MQNISMCWMEHTGGYQVEQLSDRRSIMLSLMNGGSSRYRFAKPDVVVAQGSAFAFRAANSMSFMHGSEQAVLRMSEAALKERLELILDRDIGVELEFRNIPVMQSSIAYLSAFVVQSQNPLFLDMATGWRRNISVIENFLLDVFLLNYPHSFTEALKKPVTTIAPRQVKRALAYIHDHPREHVTAEFLASLSGVSLRSMQATFKHTTGVPIGKYQATLKLKEARAMILQDRNLPLQSIAEIWGFSSAAHFSLAFRKEFGVSPSSLRR